MNAALTFRAVVVVEPSGHQPLCESDVYFKLLELKEKVAGFDFAMPMKQDGPIVLILKAPEKA